MRLFARTDPTLAFLHRLRTPQWSAARLLRSAGRGSAAGVALALALLVCRVVAGDNLHEVQPGRVYRAGQMKPERLAEFLREREVRTVVNLRGHCPEFDWYRDECRVTHDAGVSQEDVTLSAIRLPAPSEVRRLLEVLDHAEYPILLHCRQGVDRTGLAAVVVRLLEPGVTLAEARRQLGLGFGYAPFNGTENMRRFIDLYRAWLERLDQVHAPEHFRYWARHEYCPGECRGRLEPLESWSADWPAGQGRVLRLRAHNDSIETWRLRPGTNQGVHVRYEVYRNDGSVVFAGRAGLFDAQVASGQSVDLELGVPPLPPGMYGLNVNLIAADENAFCQFGGDPLIHEFRVGP